MLQRILGGVLVLLGLAAVALGVASATVWRDSDTVVATAEPVGDGTMVVTDPGVLGLVSDDVTVKATAPEGQQVTLAVGRDVDVLGWVGDDAYSRVTGLTDWENLGVEAGETAADDEAAPDDEAAAADEAAADEPVVGPEPAGSDMWVAEASDEGSVTLRWSDRPGRWTLLAAGVGDDAQAPTLELTWPRSVSTPFLWPGVGVGAVLILLGAALFVVGGRRRKAGASTAGRDDVAGTANATEPTDGDGAGADVADRGDAPESGTTNPFAPVRTTSRTTSAAPAGNVGTIPASPTPAADDDGLADGEDGAVASGTAEVPVAARLLRRSRRAQAAAPEAAAPAAPEPSPAAEAALLPEADGPEETTVTGSLPRLTRRELRAQEEARRAAEQGGVARMLRAVTGSIPAVRPSTPEPDATTGQDGSPDMSTPAGRAAAWRATWGFGQGTDQPGSTTGTTDGENR